MGYLSQDTENRNNKNYKTVTTKSITTYTDRIEYSVSYDDGTSEKCDQSRFVFNGSKHPRYQDFIINANLGDQKESNNNEDRIDSEHTSK